MILGEIEFGILSLPISRRRTLLESWFGRVIQTLVVIDFDKSAAAAWARLLVKLKNQGLVMPIKDSLIAATAIAHGLKVVTRNTSDFNKSGVGLVNPFSS